MKDIMMDLFYAELDNTLLENTDFIKAYSKLVFNRGFIFKRVGSVPQASLQNFITRLDTKIAGVQFQNTGEIKRIGANQDVHDFVFDFLTNTNIKDLNWQYKDEEQFTFIEPVYNSIEKFRTIGLFEIDRVELKNRLHQIAGLGSAYDKLKESGEEIIQLIDDFLDKLELSKDDRVILATQPWGQFCIGVFFSGIFILRKTDLIIFTVDDYD
jgi:hypothetical protein